jgi:hypothetical protein
VKDTAEDQLGQSFDHPQLGTPSGQVPTNACVSARRCRPTRIDDRTDGVQMDDGFAFVGGPATPG